MSEPMSVFVGMDVGDKTSQLTVLDPCGRVIQTATIRTAPAAVAAWFTRCQRARVVLEVGTHSRWLARAITALGHDVVVANPRRTQLIANSRNKSDRRDAELLARLGRFDPQLLGPIQHRSEEAQGDLVVIRARDALVRERTRLINHARGIVKSFGVRLCRCSPESFHKRALDQVPDHLRPALGPIFSCIEVTNLQIVACEERIQRRAREAYPETARLEQVSGVGPITSLAYVLTLEDPARFRNSRAVGAFVGLTSARRQSGDTDPECHITKAGDPLLRRLLVNCAHYVLSRGPESDLKRWGLALAMRGKKNAKKRAVVATARKLAVLLHRLWVTGEQYVATGYTPSRPLAA